MFARAHVLQIPKSYLTLQEAVLAESQRRDAEDEVQYLTDLELEQIIEQSPGSDIKDYEDLQTGNKCLLHNYMAIITFYITNSNYFVHFKFRSTEICFVKLFL